MWLGARKGETMRTKLLPVMALLLAACSAPDKMAKEVHDGASAPLSDLNLIRAEIPPVLAAAAKAPYAEPESRSCPALAAKIEELDAVLGADLDTPVTAVNPSLIERGINLATDTAARQVRSVATVVVPYRGWVRKLSGAEK